MIPMKIVNTKKFLRSILIIIGITILLSLMIGNKTFSHKDVEYEELYVSNGDTLWTIASNLRESTYYKDKDVRYIIDDLTKINELETKDLSVDQKLLIPVT